MNEELRVIEILKERGLTQKDFAEQIGISRVGLAKALSGNTTLATLRKMADTLGVPLADLFRDRSTFLAVVKSGEDVQCFNTREELLAYLND